jgi:hypothetical protein
VRTIGLHCRLFRLALTLILALVFALKHESHRVTGGCASADVEDSACAGVRDGAEDNCVALALVLVVMLILALALMLAFALKCELHRIASGCASAGAEDSTRAGVGDGAEDDGAGTDAGAGAGTGAGTGAGAGTVADAGAGTGADAGADAGTEDSASADAGTSAVCCAGTDAYLVALTFALWRRALVLTCCCAGNEQDFFAILWMVNVPLFVILLCMHAWPPERIFPTSRVTAENFSAGVLPDKFLYTFTDFC